MERKEPCADGAEIGRAARDLTAAGGDAEFVALTDDVGESTVIISPRVARFFEGRLSDSVVAGASTMSTSG